jgi:hypothetical protein
MQTACKPNSRPIVGALRINRPEAPHFTEDFDEEELEPAVTELKPKFTEERSRLRSERQRTLQWHYDIGTIVGKHYAVVQREREKHNQSMYGERFFDRLTALIPDVPTHLLHKCYRLATVYNPKAFRELIKHEVITPSHALQLAALSDAKDRAHFQAKVIAEGLTYKQLYDAIKQKFGVRRKPGAGRPMKVPRDVTKALIHLNAQADNFIHCNERVWFGAQFDIIESLTDLPSSLLSDQFKKQLTAAAETCEKLAELANTDAERLREALSEVERRMALQAKFEQQAQEELACAAAG